MGCASSTKAVRATSYPLPGTPATGSKDDGGPQEDFHDNYLLGIKIGKGTYAQVRVASKRAVADEESMAVKILDMRVAGHQSNEKKLRRAQSEACLWKQVSDHTNCVKLHECFFDQFLCYMVMERCNCGLFQYLEDLTVLNEQSLGTLCAQLLSGIRHLHQLGVVHRDVKPDNMLVGGDDGHTLKLADFGCAVALPESGKLQGVHGTAHFMCPEMLQTRQFDAKADVWSAGVVMYLLLCGNFPYVPQKMTSKEMQRAIAKGGDAECGRPWLSDNVTIFLAALLSRSPHKRPSAVEALRLPHMVDIMTDSHMLKVDLPCLHPVRESACRQGTLVDSDLSKETCIDSYLYGRQMACHNAPMPLTPTGAQGSPKVLPVAELSRAMVENCAKAFKSRSDTFNESTDCGSSSTSSLMQGSVKTFTSNSLSRGMAGNCANARKSNTSNDSTDCRNSVISSGESSRMQGNLKQFNSRSRISL